MVCLVFLHGGSLLVTGHSLLLLLLYYSASSPLGSLLLLIYLFQLLVDLVLLLSEGFGEVGLAVSFLNGLDSSLLWGKHTVMDLHVNIGLLHRFLFIIRLDVFVIDQRVEIGHLKHCIVVTLLAMG